MLLLTPPVTITRRFAASARFPLNERSIIIFSQPPPLGGQRRMLAIHQHAATTTTAPRLGIDPTSSRGPQRLAVTPNQRMGPAPGGQPSAGYM